MSDIEKFMALNYPSKKKVGKVKKNKKQLSSDDNRTSSINKWKLSLIVSILYFIVHIGYCILVHKHTKDISQKMIETGIQTVIFFVVMRLLLSLNFVS